MVSTTGEHAAWFELDADLKPREAEIPAAVRTVVERIGENCEPALASVLFMAGARGTLRAGAAEDAVRPTPPLKDARSRARGDGAPWHVSPGGGGDHIGAHRETPTRDF